MSTLFDVEAPEPQPQPEPKWTERKVLDLLHARFGRAITNGAISQPRYVCAEHVRRTPLWAAGIADFMAIDTWGSGRFATHGFEVKVSRSDWLAELRAPDKAEIFRPFCDYWWLVTSDKTIVRDDLPSDWGHLCATPSGHQLRLVVDAPRNPTVEPMTKAMTAALLRAVMTTSKRRALAVHAEPEASDTTEAGL